MLVMVKLRRLIAIQNQIFTEERSPDDQLPPARILEHIKQCAPKLSVPYLEFLIHERGDKVLLLL